MRGSNQCATSKGEPFARGMAAGEVGKNGAGERVMGCNGLVRVAGEDDLSPKGCHCGYENSRNEASFVEFMDGNKDNNNG